MLCVAYLLHVSEESYKYSGAARKWKQKLTVRKNRNSHQDGHCRPLKVSEDVTKGGLGGGSPSMALSHHQHLSSPSLKFCVFSPFQSQFCRSRPYCHLLVTCCLIHYFPFQIQNVQKRLLTLSLLVSSLGSNN